jgi:pyruvate/2-oxoglutarate dehydrogenase complex dihydrolipoamide acyltransferase (E2) component
MASFELKLPKLGESVTEGTLGKWLKKPGDKIEKYELLVEVQTDKVSTEIPSPVSGTLKEVKVQEGETVPNNTVIAVLEVTEAAAVEARRQDGAAEAPLNSQPGPAAAPTPARAPEPLQEQRPPQQPQPTQRQEPVPQRAAQTSVSARGDGAAARPAASVVPAASDEERGPSRATPVVRRLAAEHDIDLAAIAGTGLNGRVTRQDVEAAIAGARAPAATRPAAPAAPPLRPLAADTPVPLTQMRRAIAANMAQAWTAPHAHAVMEIDMTNAMRYREQVAPDFKAREGFDLSPAAFIVKAAVEALRQVPLVNAAWTDQGIVLRKAINVGYAVALGEEGLVVPVIKGADELSLAGIMRRIRDVVDRAKGKKLQFADFEGGTFTVNNTGPLGTFVSSPIVPPGQAAIISSERIAKRVVVLEDDAIAIRWMMNLVIGFDHRVIDGATAARFLQLMRDWLQAVGPSVPVY